MSILMELCSAHAIYHADASTFDYLTPPKIFWIASTTWPLIVNMITVVLVIVTRRPEGPEFQESRHCRH